MRQQSETRRVLRGPLSPEAAAPRTWRGVGRQVDPLGKHARAKLPALQLRMPVQRVLCAVDIRRARLHPPAVGEEAWRRGNEGRTIATEG